jgi:hypothetical protein
MKRRSIVTGALMLGSLHAIGPSMAVASNEVSAGRKPEQQSMEKEMTTQHDYVGMWVTDGGHIRHELLPNGRYDEARGTRNSAYQGRYEIKGITSTIGTTPVLPLTASSSTNIPSITAA